MTGLELFTIVALGTLAGNGIWYLSHRWIKIRQAKYFLEKWDPRK